MSPRKPVATFAAAHAQAEAEADVRLALVSVLAESARYYPSTVAVVDGADRYTYRELWQRASAVGGALAERGIGKGDHVALLCPNTVDFVVAYFAVQARGAVVGPVPAMLVAEEIAYLLDDSGARQLIAHPAFFGTALKAAELAGVTLVTTRPVTAGAVGAAGAVADLETLAASATPIT
nr:class I adenylate-forming enzyme family protein [Micromonospora sp. DSM 115978]